MITNDMLPKFLRDYLIGVTGVLDPNGANTRVLDGTFGDWVIGILIFALCVWLPYRAMKGLVKNTLMEVNNPHQRPGAVISVLITGAALIASTTYGIIVINLLVHNLTGWYFHGIELVRPV